MAKKEDKHHCLPRSRGGGDKGISKWKRKRHQDWHRLFVNDLPHEAAQKCLLWNSVCVKPEALTAIFNLIDELCEDGNFYKEECIEDWQAFAVHRLIVGKERGMCEIVYCDFCGNKCIQRKWGRLEFTPDGRLKEFTPEPIEKCPKRDETRYIKAPE